MNASNPAHEPPADRNVYDATREAVHAAATDARFDAVDAKFAAVDGRFDAVDAKFAAVDGRFDAVDAKFSAVDGRFDAMDGRLDAIDGRLEAITAKIDDLGRHVDDRFFRLQQILIAGAFVIVAALLGTQL